MICVSLAHMDFDTCLQHVGMEPFVEFRFDLLDLGPAQVISLVSKSKRCIATCRPGKHNEKNRLLILQTALEAGADYVDFDMESDPYLNVEYLFGIMVDKPGNKGHENTFLIPSA